MLGSLVERGVDGIAMFSTDNEDVRNKVNEVCARGIPVVTYNSDIHNANRLCYVGQDHYRGGVVAGEIMSKIVHDSGDILIISSLLELSCHEDRVSGFQAAIKDWSNSLNISRIVENQDRDPLGFELAHSELVQNPKLRGIYVTGGGVSGVVAAVNAIKREPRIRIICHDLIGPTIRSVREGIIDFTIGQDPIYQGYQSVKILFEYLMTGARPDKEFVWTKIDVRCSSNLAY